MSGCTRKQRLAAGFRLFSKLGFDEGSRDAHHRTRPGVSAGHVLGQSVRRPFQPRVNVSNLRSGATTRQCRRGDYPVTTAAFVIHSRVHAARPVAQSPRPIPTRLTRRAFSTLGRPLAPITQDVCAFCNDHAVYDDFGGVAVRSLTKASASRSASTRRRSLHREAPLPAGFLPSNGRPGRTGIRPIEASKSRGPASAQRRLQPVRCAQDIAGKLGKLSKCENLVPARIASFRQAVVTASHLGESAQAANSVSPPNP